MKNTKLKIGLVLFLFLNLILIIVGFILIDVRKNKLIKETHDFFTTNQIVKYDTNNEVDNFDDMVKLFDPIRGEEKNIDDSVSYEFRKKVLTKYFTGEITFNNIGEIIFSMGGIISSSKWLYDPIIPPTLILLDKGTNLSGMKDAENILTDIGLSDTISIAIATTLMGLNLESIADIIKFDEVFSYDEKGFSEKSFYDFSKISKGDYLGDDKRKGMKNWGEQEVRQFYQTVGLDLLAVTVVKNDDGTKSISFNENNKFTSFDLWKIMNKEDNIKQLWFNYLTKISLKYNTLRIKYDYYVPKKNSSIGNKWSFSKETEYVDSVSEYFIYDIYKHINWKSYFDKSLDLDSLNEYTSQLIPSLYIDKKFPPDQYKYNKDDEKSVKIEDIPLYSKENNNLNFGDFFFLNKYYMPFLRSANFDNFIWDISKLITNGVKLSDLGRPI